MHKARPFSFHLIYLHGLCNHGSCMALLKAFSFFCKFVSIECVYSITLHKIKNSWNDLFIICPSEKKENNTVPTQPPCHIPKGL